MSLSAQAPSDSAPPDSAANKWNAFAAKEFHKTKTCRTLPAVSPDSSHSWQSFAAQASKSPPFEPRRSATPRKSVSESNRSESGRTTLSVASPRQSNNSQRKLYIPDPPLCFCRKKAHERATSTGIILECKGCDDDDDDDDKRTICAFHVHKDAWDRVRQLVRDNKALDKNDPAIVACPAFNLTFSIITRLNNGYPKSAAATLHCFCNNPVGLNWFAFKSTQKLYFGCHDLKTMNAPLRCGFYIRAEDAHFKAPDVPLHCPAELPSSSVSISSYSSASSDHLVSTPAAPSSGLPSPAAPSPAVPSASSPSSHCSSPAAQPASPVLTFNEDASIYSPPKPMIYIPQRTRSEGDNRPNIIQLLQGARIPAWFQEEDDKPKCIIPSSVLSRQAVRNKKMDEQRAKEKLELERKIDRLEGILEQLTADNEQLRLQTLEKQVEIDALADEQEGQRTTNQGLLNRAEKLAKEAKDLEALMELTQKELDEEVRLRQKAQKRHVQLEMIVSDLLDAHEQLTKEVHDKEEKLNLKDLKCRVCFQENIEYALVPCYHCSYCKTCAEKLSECAICRTTKFAVQKVYMA